MEENSINSEKNYNKDSILFPALSFSTTKNHTKKMKCNSTYDINNKFPTNTFEEFILNNVNEENIGSLFINEIQDDNQSSKLVNNSFLNKNFEFLLEKHDKKRRNNNLGRKRKNSSEKGAHNKYTSDNLIRKCKAVMINILSNLINKKISENYNDELPFQNKKRKLMKMHQYQIVNSNIKYNQLFLNKTLKEIFSENLSTRCTTFPQEHNKDLVNDLLNEKDLKKKEIFENLFNLTFLDCIEHFRGSKFIIGLKDLQKYDKVVEKLDGDEDYKESFRCYIDNFETIINNKRSRLPYKDRKVKNKGKANKTKN